MAGSSLKTTGAAHESAKSRVTHRVRHSGLGQVIGPPRLFKVLDAAIRVGLREPPRIVGVAQEAVVVEPLDYNLVLLGSDGGDAGQEADAGDEGCSGEHVHHGWQR